MEKRKHSRLAEEIAQEGIVLLENHGILPLDLKERVALYGQAARHTIKGGTGSGDVNCRRTVSVEQGMRELGANLEETGWLDAYDQVTTQARDSWRREIEEKEAQGQEFIDAYFETPYQNPQENLIEKEQMAKAGTVLYALGRISGEGADRSPGKGDFQLSDSERENLRRLDAAGKRIILVLNTGGILDLRFVDEFSGIQAVILLGQAGMEAGRALAKALYGQVNPSGRLTDTWAASYDQYPSWDTFGRQNGDVTKEFYYEGIYVGYRWFDCFQKKVRYPFGYGLSYTSFDEQIVDVQAKGKAGYLDVTVKNTGERYSGKEVLQLYLHGPKIENVAREEKKLVAFAKSRLLSPGTEEVVRLNFELRDFMRFDEKLSAWILDAGDYLLCLGENAAVEKPAAVIRVMETVTEKVSPVCPVRTDFEEWSGENLFSENSPILSGNCPVIEVTIPGTEPLYVVSREKEKMEEEILKICESLTQEEKIHLVCGVVSQDSKAGASAVSVPGAAGETVKILRQGEEFLPGIILADGPAGVRLARVYETDDCGNLLAGDIKSALEGGFFADEKPLQPGRIRHEQYTTAFPVGTTAAQTWNEGLLCEFGRAVAEEMADFQVDLWLAPGMNIHRNPLCGRNFEYFSEDPYLTGKMAAAVTRGVQENQNTGVTIKHFACNSQEDNRMGVGSIVGERALREIYLRGFETAVREAQPEAIMTSYNKLNGSYTSNCEDLCTIAARQEWGFQGMIMTDWTTTEHGSVSWKCVKAGNDLIMPGSAADHENIRKALKEGSLTEEELDICVCRIIRGILRLKRNRN